MAATHRLAIDLGTCHTVAVVRRGDEPPRSLLFDGSPLLASGGYANPDGTVFVGRDAERMSQVDPTRYEPYPKRRVDDGRVLLGDTEVPVVELLAALLRRVASEALQAGVNPAGVTVLTCPADWGPQRRGVLLAASRVANLGPVELVDEPIAAAAYCQDVLNQQIPAGRCLAVFDFGGGTLDVTVVRREPAGLGVMAVGGLDDLGGVDFDAALVGHLGQLIELRDPAVWRRLCNPTRPAEQRDRRAFWSEVRSAKEMLSRTAAAPVQVPGCEDALHLTRDELERVAGPLVDRAVDETRRVFQRANVDPRQLAGIFLVGGSSRMPLVASRLHARFGVAPTVPEQPELPVAYGGLLAVGGYGTPGALAQPPGALAQPPGVPGAPGSAIPSSPAVGYPMMPTSPSPYPPAGPVSGPGSYPSGPGSYPGGPISPPGGIPPVPPVPSSTSFPPVQLGAGTPGTPAAPPVGPPWRPAPGLADLPGPVRPGTAGPGSARRPRRRVGRYVALAVALALLAACGTGGWALYKVINKAGSALASASQNGGGTGGGGGVGNPFGDAAKLTSIAGPTSLPGTQETAVAAGRDAVYYAVIGQNKTDVVAVATAGGKDRWQVSVAAEPTDVHLTLVGDLLIVDGERVDSQGGKDVRAVLDAKTGTQKWLAGWDGLRDVEYIGTDAIVEWGASIKTSVRRVDLLTGKIKWEHPGPTDSFIIDSRLVRPTLAWPAAGTAATAWPAAYGEADHGLPGALVVDPGVVVLVDDGNGKGVAVNAADGKTKATGALGYDPDAWTVFGGLVIGKLEDSNKIRAVGVSDFKLKWDAPLASGSTVDRMNPCAQNLVCAAVSDNNGDDNIVAFDLVTGQQKWSYKLDAIAVTDLDWRVVNGQLLVGDAPFTSLTDVVALNVTDGKAKYQLADQANSLIAAAGAKAASTGTRVSGGSVKWQIAVVDVASGKADGVADLGGAAPPKQAAISDSAVVVIDASRQLRIFKISTK